MDASNSQSWRLITQDSRFTSTPSVVGNNTISPIKSQTTCIHLSFDTTTATNKYNKRKNELTRTYTLECTWKYLDPSHSHDIYILFTSLISRLCITEGIFLLPYQDLTLESINQGPNIPKDPTIFTEYCHAAYTSSNNRQVTCIFKLQIDNQTYNNFKTPLFPWFREK